MRYDENSVLSRHNSHEVLYDSCNHITNVTISFESYTLHSLYWTLHICDYCGRHWRHRTDLSIFLGGFRDSKWSA